MNSLLDFLCENASEQEPPKIEILEKDMEPAPLKTVIFATTVNEDEDVQTDINLGSEIEKSGEEGSSVASEVFEESPVPMEKLDFKLESEEAGNTSEIAVLPSALAEPEANVPTLHSSTEEEPAEPTVSSIEVKSDDCPETLSETTTAHPPADYNVSIPEPTLIPKDLERLETSETAVASQLEEVATKADPADDKETIPPSVIDNKLPTIEASVDEMPTD